MTLSTAVALCSYNGSRYLAEQLRSILEQVPPIEEIVIGDDGSVDETLALVAHMLPERSAAGGSTRVLDVTPMLGPSANFSRTLAATSGDVTFLADQDDVWSSGRVAHVVERMATSPEVHVLSQDAALIDGAGRPLGRSLFESMGVTAWEIDTLNGPDALRVLLRRNFLPGMSMAVARDLLRRCLPVPSCWPHDYWIAACAAALGTLRVSPDPRWLNYRQHDANVLGAGARGLRHRVRRVLSEPNDPERGVQMFTALADWIEQQPDAMPGASELVRRKVEAEIMRASLPPALGPRVYAALRLLRGGIYAEFGSNGRWNVVRDLLHAPEQQDGRSS